MEVLQVLTDYYSNYDEDGRLLSKHGQVEYLTTMRYINKYLRPGMRILEVGAATGRYSHALAQAGYCVDAVELVQHNIDIFNEKTVAGENVTIRQGDARDLSFYGDDIFDMTLILGPMYHLFTEEDRKQALREAIRVTKPGGIIFAAYCGNEATLVQYCFGRGMIRQQRYLDNQQRQRIIQQKMTGQHRNLCVAQQEKGGVSQAAKHSVHAFSPFPAA